MGEVYGTDLHAKRIDSLAGATLGVMQSASLAVAMIGQALAQVAEAWSPSMRSSRLIGC